MNHKIMKVIVAHAGQQHSYKTAEAFNEKGCLLKYATTVYYKPWSLTRLVSYFLPGSQKTRCRNRVSNNLPNDKVLQIGELRGLFILALRRSETLQRLFPNYIRNLTDDFGISVAKYAIKHKADAVIMYDTNSNTCFKYLKEHAPEIKRVLDVTIANRLYLKTVYEKEMVKYPEYKEHIYNEQKDVVDDLSHDRRIEEVDTAQYFLAGSNFVKKSLVFSGVKPDSVFVVNYGVDKLQFTFNAPRESQYPLNLLFVGQVNFRKGLHHLLSVASKYTKEQVILNIVGGVSNNNVLYSKYKDCDNIKFWGFLTRDKISKIFGMADVFVLPSLAEGFALVSLEALSSGLPVICTSNSGCNDVIVDEHNGFVIDVSNEEQLNAKIVWFLENMAKIPSMKENARRTVKNLAWSDYRKNVVEAVCSIIEK